MAIEWFLWNCCCALYAGLGVISRTMCVTHTFTVLGWHVRWMRFIIWNGNWFQTGIIESEHTFHCKSRCTKHSPHTHSDLRSWWMHIPPGVCTAQQSATRNDRSPSIVSLSLIQTSATLVNPTCNTTRRLRPIFWSQNAITAVRQNGKTTTETVWSHVNTFDSLVHQTGADWISVQHYGQDK